MGRTGEKMLTKKLTSFNRTRKLDRSMWTYIRSFVIKTVKKDGLTRADLLAVLHFYIISNVAFGLFSVFRCPFSDFRCTKNKSTLTKQKISIIHTLCN